MSSASVIQRSADSSAFVSSIKSRGSSTNPNSIPVLYKSEVNTALCCKSKVVASPNTSVGYDRLVQIELQNYDHLQKLFLKTTFSAGDFSTNVSSTTNAIALKDWIGAFVGREFRIVYNGTILAKLTPAYIVARLMKEAGTGERVGLCNMLGGWDTSTSGSYVVADGTTIDSQKAEGRTASPQEFYCPLPFWFSEKSALALDCGILHGRLTLEIDVDTKSNCHSITGSGGEACELTNMEAVQYSCSLHPRQEEEHRALSYSPKQPLTQIGYDITEFSEMNLENDKKHAIKLNSITGYVQRLWIIMRSESDTANFKNYAIKSATLKAMGSEIYKCEDLSKAEGRLEDYVNGNFHTKLNTNNTITENTNVDNNSIFCMDFKDVNGSKLRSACNGGISFAGLSVPTLEVQGCAQDGSMNGQELAGTDAKLKFTIIAESYNMVVYSTNESGATSLKTLRQ